MKIKTSELTGAALDWAVAMCEGVNEETFHLFYEPTEPTDYDSHGYPEFHYSTTWSQGGPIIEREKIDLLWDVELPHKDGWWRAGIDAQYEGDGPTPLVAAMRCYCCAKLGDEVDVPKELI